MKQRKKLLLVMSFLVLILSVASCKLHNTEKIKNASIKQVLATESIQNDGYYLLNDGKLTIYKKISMYENLDQAIGNSELTTEEKNNINKFLKNDFPTEYIEKKDDLFQDFTREIKDSYIVIDERNEKTTIYGKDYKNEFSWVNKNGTRLKDSNSVEYSFEVQ